MSNNRITLSRCLYMDTITYEGLSYSGYVTCFSWLKSYLLTSALSSNMRCVACTWTLLLKKACFISGYVSWSYRVKINLLSSALSGNLAKLIYHRKVTIVSYNCCCTNATDKPNIKYRLLLFRQTKYKLHPFYWQLGQGHLLNIRYWLFQIKLLEWLRIISYD